MRYNGITVYKVRNKITHAIQWNNSLQSKQQNQHAIQWNNSLQSKKQNQHGVHSIGSLKTYARYSKQYDSII